jgi:neutral ceramidase
MTLAAGYGEACINPDLGAGLVGYGPYAERPGEAVLDRLMARAVAVSNGGAPLVLASCDVLGFTVAESDAIRAAMAEAAGTSLQRVLLACTHTHSGPASQQLRAMAPVDPAYLTRVREGVLAAMRGALATMATAALRTGTQIVEPLGFNRRHRSFDPIDATLGVAELRTPDRRIYLASYSCHAVTLGRTRDISADWPGAAAHALAAGGDAAIVFQGYSGDIDPVTNMNLWGGGTRDDLSLMGEILASRARKAVSRADAEESPALTAAEERVALPLRVLSGPDLDAERDRWAAHLTGELYARFMEDWHTAAQAASERGAAQTLEVPVQVVRLGGIALVGMPGEVFCEVALGLRAGRGPLMPVGYSGGNVGYIPMPAAYEQPTDYACYLAPMYYGEFAFAADVADRVRRAAERLLD